MFPLKQIKKGARFSRCGNFILSPESTIRVEHSRSPLAENYSKSKAASNRKPLWEYEQSIVSSTSVLIQELNNSQNNICELFMAIESVVLLVAGLLVVNLLILLRTIGTQKDTFDFEKCSANGRLECSSESLILHSR
ncbi:unnamed protein product [Orchesella dallaii]|uniref:Uncharacterized protein n=1 Tax=Orchesella dallaii TaxID=48710 RepID=A0ABP1QT86_9HEXA